MRRGITTGFARMMVGRRWLPVVDVLDEPCFACQSPASGGSHGFCRDCVDVAHEHSPRAELGGEA